jgi:acylphosphatase
MNNVRVQLIIKGRVQGVWFRESTRREALALGVFGWVRNRSDRTVEVVIEGPEAQVKELVAWCKEGPPVARVDGVRETWEEWKGEFESFEVVF